MDNVNRYGYVTFIMRYCLIESNDGEVINYYLIAPVFLKKGLS